MWQWFKNKLVGDKDSLLTLILAFFHKETPGKIKILLVLALMYLISPLDLIPDTMPGVGIMDDLVVVPGILYIAECLVPSHLQAELSRKAKRIRRLIPWIIGLILVLLFSWIFMTCYIFYKLFTMN